MTSKYFNVMLVEVYVNKLKKIFTKMGNVSYYSFFFGGETKSKQGIKCFLH